MYNISVIKSCKKLATGRTKYMNKINDKKTTYREMYFVFDPIWKRFDYVSKSRHQALDSMYELHVFNENSTDYQIMMNA